MRERNKPERNKITKIVRQNENGNEVSQSLIGWESLYFRSDENTEQRLFVGTKIQKLSTNQRPGNFIPIFILYLRKYFVSLYRREMDRVPVREGLSWSEGRRKGVGKEKAIFLPILKGEASRELDNSSHRLIHFRTKLFCEICIML